MPFAGLRHLVATPDARRLAGRRDEMTGAALAAVDLERVAALPADQLNSADQRLLQISRAVATGATAMLLDEPAAGMTAAERGRLGAAIRGLASSGFGVLVVEHDMRLVADVADRVTVLDAGRVIASGSFGTIQRDPAVRAAYLGEAADFQEPADR